MEKANTTHNIFLFIIGTMFFALLVILLPLNSAAAPSLITARNVQPTHLHYQGRLLNPNTGVPRSDGTYSMSFSLYTQPSGGAPLWTENKDVTVNQGIFSTLLGDTSALNISIFNGQDLWLGITVNPDPQMTPRQPLAYVPYAIYAQDADTLDGYNSSAFASANHTHSTLPLAYGSVRFDGILGVGSYNVDSVTWNPSLNRYEIDIANNYYSIDDVTVVTVSGDSGSCVGGASGRQSSVSGLLLVYIVDQNGNEIQCSFRFVSFAGQ